MHGNTVTRSAMGVGHVLARPRDAARWFAGLRDRRSPLDRGLPWLSWRCIDELDRRISPGMRVLEWGAGGSTRFFLDRGCTVTSVESSPEWKAIVERRLADAVASGRLTVRLADISSRTPEAGRAYVSAGTEGGPYDVVLIDGEENEGLSRVDCARAAAAAILADRCMIIVDDAYRREYASIPEVLGRFSRTTFRGLGPCRLGVTQTDIYR